MTVAWLASRRPEAAPFALVASPRAIWSKQRDADREKVTLEQGELRIRVSHRTGARPIVVVLPDGELEDTGTTFTVGAEHGRTTHVAVEEGSVVLRLRGQSAVTIHAGERWSAPVSPPAIAATASAVPAAPASAPPSAPAAPIVDASADFRAAMAALDRGDSAAAAAAFARFVTTHPRDPRAEDAAYLRVIALQRLGDTGAMNAAAVDYLRRHPTGFRSAEVEGLTR